MYKNIFVFWSLLFLTFHVNGQQAVVKGVILDTETKTSVSGVSVNLINPRDTSEFYHTTTNEKGEYTFRFLKNAMVYRLRARLMGYNDYSRPVMLRSETVDNGAFFLIPKAHELKEVVVKVDEAPVVQNGDTTEMAAKAYKTNPDATVEDLVRKMPGITVENGKLKSNGEEIKRVLVDGKAFFGDDPNIALKNLPSEIVDKIQIYNKQSDQSEFTGIDDGQSAKIMNIVTRVDRRNGQFGKVAAGHDFVNKYLAGGNFNNFKQQRRVSVIGLTNNVNQRNFGMQEMADLGGGMGGMGGGMTGRGLMSGNSGGVSTTSSMGINYSDRLNSKMMVSGSYFYNGSNMLVEQSKNSSSLLDSSSLKYTSALTHSETNNYNHRLNLKIDFNIDSFNTVQINPNFNFQDARSKGNSSQLNYTPILDTLNTSRTNNVNQQVSNNISGNIIFKHRFRKRGRAISVNLTGNVNHGSPKLTQYSLNSYHSNFAVLQSDTISQFYDGSTVLESFSSNIAYNEPIFSRSVLQFTCFTTINNNEIDKEIFKTVNSASKLDTALSNLFDNKNVINKLGVSCLINTKFNLNYTVGIDIQGTEMESDQTFPKTFKLHKSYSNWLPNAMANYRFTTRVNLTASYRATTNLPPINSLQTAVNNTNPLMLSTGNPNLKQSYIHNVSSGLSIAFPSSLKHLSFNITYSNIVDYIGNKVIRNDSQNSTFIGNIELKPGVQLTRPENISNSWNVRSNLTTSFYFKEIKSNLSLVTGYGYSHNPNYVNQLLNFTQNYSLTQGVVIGSNISERIDFNCSYTFSYNYAKQSIQLRPNSEYLNNMASIRLNLIVWKGLVIKNDIIASCNKGLSSSYNRNNVLWNIGLGKKLFKKQTGEIRLSVYDLLKQNNNISRSYSEISIEDSKTNTTQRYYMLTFTYSFRAFKKEATPLNTLSQ